MVIIVMMHAFPAPKTVRTPFASYSYATYQNSSTYLVFSSHHRNSQWSSPTYSVIWLVEYDCPIIRVSFCSTRTQGVSTIFFFGKVASHKAQATHFRKTVNRLTYY